MHLAKKKALVTGASCGIGRSIAEALVAEGIQVFGTSRSPDDVDWPDGVIGVELDLSSSSSIQSGWAQVLERAEHFDILINNAGSGAFGEFSECAFEQWEDQVRAMLLGPMELSQLAMKKWSREKPGVLVNVSSLAVEYPIPFMSGYNSAKAGLAGFCESLLLECDPEVVRVVELRLGDVNTGFNNYVRGKPKGALQNRIWSAMCRHVEKGPGPGEVAMCVLKHLRAETVGIVRMGGFFQSILASVFGRMVSHRVKRAANLSYYK